MNSEQLKDLAIGSLEELKAQDLAVLDVRGIASFTDFMIVATGSSDRHLKAMANQVHVDSKKANNPPLSMEGQESRDWVLVDLGDVVVHIMRPEIREMYALEKLWSIGKAIESPEENEA